MKRTIIIIVIAFVATSCASHGGFRKCPTYSYIYRDIKTGIYGHGESFVYYHAAETVVLFPSMRTLVIVSVQEKVN